MLTLGPPDPSCSMSLRTDDEQPISPSLPQLVHSEELECEDLEDEEEDEDGEEEDSIPEHEFNIKTTEGKFGRMKGVTREKVSQLETTFIVSEDKSRTDLLSSHAMVVRPWLLRSICQRLQGSLKMELMNW